VDVSEILAQDLVLVLEALLLSRLQLVLISLVALKLKKYLVESYATSNVESEKMAAPWAVWTYALVVHQLAQHVREAFLAILITNVIVVAVAQKSLLQFKIVPSYATSIATMKQIKSISVVWINALVVQHLTQIVREPLLALRIGTVLVMVFVNQRLLHLKIAHSYATSIATMKQIKSIWVVWTNVLLVRLLSIVIVKAFVDNKDHISILKL